MKKNSLRSFLALSGFLAVSMPAFGTGITFTCAANIDTTHTGTCATLNGTFAGLYRSTFTNANADIYISYGATGLGSSLQYFDNIDYSAYAVALSAGSSGANDATAVASLGGLTSNPVDPTKGVSLTGALRAALGLGTGTGIGLADNPCTLGTANCYNGRITLTDVANTFSYLTVGQTGSTYDFFEATGHEVNEILGTSSCIMTTAGNPATSINCTNGSPAVGVGASDLFRYSAAGTRSYLGSANGTVAYFSINSGNTNIAGYNNTPNNADYGDWDSSSVRVQNAFGTPGHQGSNITNDGGSEIKVLDAVGYNLVANQTGAVPEPGTITLFGSAFAVLAGVAHRRRRRS